MPSRRNRNIKTVAKPAGISATDLSIATLLSQRLVAFTIELDNEFEHWMPHRTTNHRSGNHGSGFGPWLASTAMYLNCMKFVGDEGVTVGELERLARTPTNLHGMQRWGYVVVDGGPAGKGAESPKRKVVAKPGRDWVVRATIRGKMAREVWGSLFGVIEERWRVRFGRDEIERLRGALSAVLAGIDLELPECLPILGYGLFSRGRILDRSRRTELVDDRADSDQRVPTPLPVLLARVLLAFALEFESESEGGLGISLAIGANVLRVLDEEGVRVRDLPQLSGVSKEAISMAMGILGKKGLAVVETEAGARIARLAAKGVEAQHAYRRLIALVEKRWVERFGEERMHELRGSLTRIGGEALFRGLEPYPDGWRASVRKPDVLPHYPMVLHRGGYPDGS